MEHCTVLVGSSALGVGLPVVAKFSLELSKLQTSSEMMGDECRGWLNGTNQLQYSSCFNCVSSTDVGRQN